MAARLAGDGIGAAEPQAHERIFLGPWVRHIMNSRFAANVSAHQAQNNQRRGKALRSAVRRLLRVHQGIMNLLDSVGTNAEPSPEGIIQRRDHEDDDPQKKRQRAAKERMHSDIAVRRLRKQFALLFPGAIK